MNPVALELRGRRARLGLKGPKAAEWLVAQGIELPATANTWMRGAAGSAAEGLLVARLGSTEFFLEDGASGITLERLTDRLESNPTGVYPVLREDWAFLIGGGAVHDVLAQVCNVNFADLALQSHPLIMTLMVGVSVLVVPEDTAGGRRYRIWCDPTFGPYLGESLRVVVLECGGRYTGVSA